MEMEMKMNMKMKRMLTAVAGIFLVLCVIYAMWVPAQAAELITVYVNGSKIDFPDAPAYLDENGRTQVPVRFVVEALGCTVEWDDVNQYVTINGNGTTVLFMIGQRIYKVNGVTMSAMDTEAVLSDSRTYVPVRFAAEALGATVRWDNDTRSVYVDIAGVEGANGGGRTDENGDQPEEGEQSEEGEELVNSGRVAVYEDYMFDDYGLLKTQYAEPLYQELLNSIKIVYEGSTPYFCYTIPENLPDNTEFVIVLACDLADSAPDGILSWHYSTREDVVGDRAKGIYSYLMPTSGVVKKELRQIDIKYIDNIFISVQINTPPGAILKDSKLAAHPSWAVVIIPDMSRESYIYKNQYDRRGYDLPGSPTIVPLDISNMIEIK